MTVYPQVPPKVEYSLTEIGRSLEEIAGLLEDWGHRYRERIALSDPSGTIGA
ncbi:MAG: winged helix-turn-helix transcriptional regulator [Pseudonocardiaceae bacterium]